MRLRSAVARGIEACISPRCTPAGIAIFEGFLVNIDSILAPDQAAVDPHQSTEANTALAGTSTPAPTRRPTLTHSRPQGSSYCQQHCDAQPLEDRPRQFMLTSRRALLAPLRSGTLQAVAAELHILQNSLSTLCSTGNPRHAVQSTLTACPGCEAHRDLNDDLKKHAHTGLTR